MNAFPAMVFGAIVYRHSGVKACHKYWSYLIPSHTELGKSEKKFPYILVYSGTVTSTTLSFDHRFDHRKHQESKLPSPAT